MLLALVAILVNFALVTVALAPTHGHGQARSCEICQIAHLPYVATLIARAPGAPVAIALERVIELRNAVDEVSGSPAPSRAPPFAL